MKLLDLPLNFLLIEICSFDYKLYFTLRETCKLIWQTTKENENFYLDKLVKRTVDDCNGIHKETWKIGNVFHRRDGPAQIYKDETYHHNIFWYKGLKSLETSPEHISHYEANSRHRLDGPAFISIKHNYKQWFIKDIRIDGRKYKRAVEDYLKNKDLERLNDFKFKKKRSFYL